MDLQSLHITIVLITVGVVFVGMAFERIPAEVLAMGGVCILLAIGILETEDVLKAFSNNAPFTVACLFVLSAALERTGVINELGLFMARVRWRSASQALLVMMVGVAAVSTFVNNTPIVVIMTPVVIVLAHAVKVAPSRMLMPLSFATIMGGTCSLIGTSTNIIVDGVAQSMGQPAFSIFEITIPGSIMAVAGIAYLYFIGRFLLPDRQTLTDSVGDAASRRFLTEVLVPEGSPLIGRTAAQAGLTEARGYTVLDIIRNDASIDPEHGEPKLAAGDRMVLTTSVVEFLGLRDAAGVVIDPVASHALEPIKTQDVRIVEGIIGPFSSLVGQKVADLNLRRLYDTYILAIHRQGEKMQGTFSGVRLQFGDTLLLEGPSGGLKRLFQRRDLVNLSSVVERPFRRDKAWIAVLAVVLVMVLSAFEALPIAATALIAAVAVVVAGCLDTGEAYDSIHWPILMLIFAMIAIGGAMETTGAARLVVENAVSLVRDLGPAAILSLLYLITSIITAFASNNAAAILLTPIGIGLAQELGVDPRPFIVAVMFAASADFSTPVGYQTNTFVYSAGNYKFLDFTKVGLPLNIMNWIIASIVLPLWWPLTHTPQ
jgi:di/tricarboxylate transporter